jgi:methionyl aminopeptidase
MIPIKSEKDLALMRPACQMAQRVLEGVVGYIKPGITTRQVDDYAGNLMYQLGVVSAFKGYRKFPNFLCISINEQVVHGLASGRMLEFGDIVSLDVGVSYNGFIGDTARTIAVGGCSVQAQRLMDVTERALNLGIAQAMPGRRISDISHAVQSYVESNGYSIVREFVGHGVGRIMHEEPQVPNFVDGKTSPKLEVGMTIAIEPMVNEGSSAVRILGDGWTVVTNDGSLSAHFEHTVLVSSAGPEILTKFIVESEKVQVK